MLKSTFKRHPSILKTDGKHPAKTSQPRPAIVRSHSFVNENQLIAGKQGKERTSSVRRANYYPLSIGVCAARLCVSMCVCVLIAVGMGELKYMAAMNERFVCAKGK